MSHHESAETDAAIFKACLGAGSRCLLLALSWRTNNSKTVLEKRCCGAETGIVRPMSLLLGHGREAAARGQGRHLAPMRW